MKFKILFNYIRGYVKVEIQGYFIERLMNLCKKKSIILWGSNRKKASLLYTNVGIKDFKKLISISKETGCKVKIKKKKGFPFLCNKYKKRKIFFIFFFLVILIIISLSNFIWNINIEGNEKISEKEIVDFLDKNGLSIGKLKNSINTKEIINKVRLERNDIAWIGIEINGTNAKIKIVESKTKPEIIDENEYCNIVATKPGVITKINAINGVPVVKEGEIEKQGDILIEGWLEGKYTGVRYVHANGQVKAKVWYEKKIRQDLKQVKLSKTGNSETKYSVKINNFQINFYKTLSKFKKYDTIEKKQKLKLFFDFYLPIEIIKKTNYELIEEEIQYGKEEAKQIAVEEAKKMLDQEIQQKDSLLNTYINYTETEKYIEAQVIYEIVEEIGTKEKIVF